MLILARKKNEQIVIGENTIVTVLEVDGDKVKLGIEAPADVKVFRKELIEEVKSSNAESTSVSISMFDELKEQIKKNKK